MRRTQAESVTDTNGPRALLLILASVVALPGVSTTFAEDVSLPELRHERVITKHPTWMAENLRAAYAHWEWNRPMPLDAWCRRMKELGATVVMAVGNIPDNRDNHMRRSAGKGGPGRKAGSGAATQSDGTPDYAWFKQFVDTAHDAGMKFVVYSNFVQHPDELFVEHPEWRCLNANGRPDKGPCYCSPWGEAFIERLVGLLRESPCEGIYIDSMHAGRGGCRNPYCLRAFKERFGVDAPTTENPKDPVYQRWIEFQAFTREEFLLRLTEAVHQVNPEFAVIVNNDRGWRGPIANSGLISSHLHEVVDGIGDETGWDYNTRWLNPYAGPIRQSFQNNYLRSREGDGWSFRWDVTNAQPLTELRWRNLNAISYGVTPNLTSGANLDWCGICWQDIRAREKYVLHSNPLPWLGLVYSEKTLAWHYAATTEAAALPYLQNVFGAYSCALESHFPVDILSDWQLTPELLKPFRVVLLPNTAALSEEACQALRQFVDNGGGLVATYETSLFDETARKRPDFALADLFGGSYASEGEATKIGVEMASLAHPIARDEVFRRLGFWVQGTVSPTNSFDIINRFDQKEESVAPYRIGFVSLKAIRDAFGRTKASDDSRLVPAFTARQFGKGRVVYIPTDLCRAYFLNHVPTSGTLLERAIRWAAGQPAPVEIDNAQQIETAFYKQDDRLIVHLLNNGFSYGFGAPPSSESYGFRRAVIPAHDLAVRIHRDAKRVLLIPGEQSLPVERHADWSEVIVPKLELHAMLVVE